MARCDVCFRHCDIPEGGRGFCGARVSEGGWVRSGNYGRITSLALDPIEKKPLRRFFPGSMILSVGSWGCNLRCPFCQNHRISWSAEAMALADRTEYLAPEDLIRLAEREKRHGNIGLAFTYNEPLVGWEYVRDAAALSHGAGLKNVLVTNGTAEEHVLEELLPFIDAMNIDLKGFSERRYRDVLGGDLGMVKAFISHAVGACHVELTTLVVPGENDTREEMLRMAEWIASLTDREGRSVGEEIPLHVTRFFPRFHMTDRAATDPDAVRELAEAASRKLKYVYTGNI